MAAAVSVSNLTVVGGQNLFSAMWSLSSGGTCLPDLLIDAVELWASADNDRANAVKMQEGLTSAVDAGYQSDVTRYFWIRARDASGNYSAWHPASATGGVEATTRLVINADLGEDSVGDSNVQDDAIKARHIQVDSLEAITAVLGNVVVTGSLIVDGTLVTSKYADNSITALSAAASASGAGVAGVISGSSDPDLSAYWTTMQAAAITGNGSEIIINGNLQAVAYGAGDDYAFVAVRLLRDGAELIQNRKWIYATPNVLAFYPTPFSVHVVDLPAAGAHTYTLQAAWYSGAGSDTYAVTAFSRTVDCLARKGK